MTGIRVACPATEAVCCATYARVIDLRPGIAATTSGDTQCVGGPGSSCMPIPREAEHGRIMPHVCEDYHGWR
jgi:hypothetical protein